MRGMHQCGGELALAKFFHNVHLIDIADAGIFGHQLDPAHSLPIFLGVKIMDMLIAQSFHMDAFPFSRQTVIGGFGMLNGLRLVNVERNGTHVQWQVIAQDRSGSDEFHTQFQKMPL